MRDAGNGGRGEGGKGGRGDQETPGSIDCEHRPFVRGGLLRFPRVARSRHCLIASLRHPRVSASPFSPSPLLPFPLRLLPGTHSTPVMRKAKACSQGFSGGISIFRPRSSCTHFKGRSVPSSSTFSILPRTWLEPVPSAAIDACRSGQPITNA